MLDLKSGLKYPWGAPKRLWNIGPMLNIAAAGIEISKLTLAGGFPFRLSTNDATVTFREIRFSMMVFGFIIQIIT